jgi:hypothetical protein
MKAGHLLFDYYTTVSPNSRVLDLCGVGEPGLPYTRERDNDLTVIINAYARPVFLPLVWEAVQYQTRRPRETWIVQNHPEGRSAVPADFLSWASRQEGTRVVSSGLNHGCWFRFFLAALSCRTRYVAIYDDDTLSARRALETALADLEQQPGVYGGRGIIFNHMAGGPRYWAHEISGWPAGNAEPEAVDFVGHLWVMETWWLKELFRHVPDRVFAAPPGRECGEDMYISFVAQKLGIPTFTYRHGGGCNERWSSIQAFEMGLDAVAMNMSGGLNGGDAYLRHYVAAGWRLLRYPLDSASDTA